MGCLISDIFVMETIDDSEVENVDPRFTELPLLQSSYCDRMTHESIKTEREHTNEKIKVVIKKLSELNQDIVNHDNKIRDLNMKIDTFFAYHEELLFNLKSGLQDTFQCVQDDMKYVLTKLEIRTRKYFNILCGLWENLPGLTIISISSMHHSQGSLPTPTAEPSKYNLF